MCGIAFINTRPGSELDVRRCSRALLIDLAARGRDASGVAWKRSDGTTLYRKVLGHPALLASNLAQPSGTRSLDASRAVLVHTRFATIGTPYDSANNHPIIRPGVAMVHNGSVRNARDLYRMAGAKQRAQVDSDAIAALIQLADDRDDLHEMFRAIDGLAAVAWLDVTDDPDDAGTLHAARIDTRPLIVGATTDGDLIAASTEDSIRRAALNGGAKVAKMVELPEGASITCRDGEVTYTAQIGTGSGKVESTVEYETAPVRQGHLKSVATG